MPEQVKQIPVSIKIDGTGNNAQIFYTYINPADTKLVVNSPTCTVAAAEPYYTLFAIDYTSSAAGWQFHPSAPLIPKPDSQAPTFTTPEDRLSLRTLDQSATVTYKFDFIFINTVNGSQTISDPQEGNAVVPGEITIRLQPPAV